MTARKLVQIETCNVHCVSVFLRGSSNMDATRSCIARTSVNVSHNAVFVVLPPQGTQVMSLQEIQSTTAQDPRDTTRQDIQEIQETQAQDIQETQAQDTQETPAQGRLHSRSTLERNSPATPTKRL